MKRFIVYGSLLLLLSMALAAEHALQWLLESPGGVTWLLGAVSRHTPVTLSARTISGGPGPALSLGGFSARWPGGELAIDDMHLRWQPMRIPFGVVAVRELSLRGVRFRDNAPPGGAGAEFVWPRITGLPSKFSGAIDSLTIDNFTYQRKDRPSISFPHISASLIWRDTRLTVARLSLKTAHGTVSGTATAGFGTASLISTLSFKPFRVLAGCDRFEVRTRLHSGNAPDQVAGNVTAIAANGNDTKYTLAGAVALTGRELDLRTLIVTRNGRRGEVQLSGVLPFAGEARLHLSASGLDLSPELGESSVLAGTLDLSGNVTHYAGRLHLAGSGSGWRKTELTGHFQGDSGSVALSGMTAAVLDGTLRGNLIIGWRDDLTVAGKLYGNGLNPAGIHPSWNGVVNFDLDRIMASWSNGRLRGGEAHGRLRASRLRGKALSGEVAATLEKDNLTIDRLFLAGNGFDIVAGGILRERLDVTAHISDLSGLIPQATGSLVFKGWGRYTGGEISVDFSGHGSDIAVAGIQIASASLSARSAEGGDHATTAAAELKDVTYHGMHAEHALLTADGSPRNHRLSLALGSSDAAIRGQLAGRYGDGRWQGNLTNLTGQDTVGPWQLDAPAALTASTRHVAISPLVLNGLPSERVELAGRLNLKPLTGTAQANWSGLNLARANPWLHGTTLAAQSTGRLRIGLTGENRINLAGTASASGVATVKNRAMTITKALFDLDAGDRGTTATLEFRTGEGISASGRFTSPAPATLSFPSHGTLLASWNGLDAALAKRWLPQGTGLQGKLSGKISGQFLPEQHFDLNGSVALTDGTGSWRGDGKELAVAARSAGLTWHWRGDDFTGAFSLSLAQPGEVHGNFQLPLQARFGATINHGGQIRGAISGNFQENGVVTALFPGLLQEAKGLLKIDLQAGGTWQTPSVGGTVGLTQAAAYLPSAGIRLTDVRLDARLDASSNGTQVHIESLRLASGAGSLEGTAHLSFAGNTLTSYHGSLHGEHFQAVHLPELELVVAPDLTFEGSPDALSAHGLVRVPKMLLSRLRSSEEKKSSRDVVLTGRAKAAPKLSTPLLDLQLQILLGDQVTIKAQGLDARLEGGVHLRVTGPTEATGTGEIKVAKGTYRIYGVNLDIRRGRALFTGGALERPALDILAVRTVDDVMAGVAITGTPERPLIKLFSEPALPDTEVLSYVVLGRSLGESDSQRAMLMEAASLLVSPDHSSGLQEQLKEWIALDTITLSSDKDPRSGYKAMIPSLRSSSQSNADSGGVSQTMLQLGKYLTPELYVSYGKSLFDQSQQLRARYSISRQWEVESKVSSTTTGGDIYYRIELD